MPSFPDSVWAPTAKASGNTIQAAHVNDAQDEIVAIEGGYRNGTAPLNSSGSTLVTLNVSGGSTLASLDVNGNTTLASTVAIGSLQYIWPGGTPSTGQSLTIDSTSGSTITLKWSTVGGAGGGLPDANRLELDAAQEFAVSTGAVNWSSQVFQTNSSLHSTGTNPSRITPQTTGVYLCIFGAMQNSNTGMEYFIEDSSGGIIAGSGGSTNERQVLSGIKYFDATGGYVRAIVRPLLTTNSLNAGAATFFSFVEQQ